MNIFTIFGISIIACVLCVILRKWRPEFAIITSLFTGVVVLSLVMSQIIPVTETISNLMTKIAIPTSYGKILFKALGICFVAQLAGDCCRDSGETAIATKIDIAAKTAVIIVALPLFEKLIEIISTLLY